MITIIFTRPKKWSLLSWLIKKFTKSQASHMMIGLEMYGVPVVIHSTMGGVQITPRKKQMVNNEILEEYKFIPDVTNGLKHSFDHLGERYDYVGLLGYAIILIMWRWFRRKMKNPLASPTALVCSEFVLHVNHDGQIKEWEGLDPERTTPQDLIEICRLNGSFVRVNNN